MKLNNPILITLNNTLHIKADNLEPVEVDSSLWDFLYHNPHTWNWNADLSTINVDHLLDRIEVREVTTHHKSDVIKTYKAFLLPAKEDELSELLEIVDKKFYTIEEIEMAIRSLHYEDYHLDIIVTHVINNLKK